MRILIAAIVLGALILNPAAGFADQPDSSHPVLVLKSGEQIAVKRLERSGGQVLAYLEGGRAMAYNTADVNLSASGLITSRPAPKPAEKAEKRELVRLGGSRALDISEHEDDPKAIVIVGNAAAWEEPPSGAEEEGGDDHRAVPSAAEAGSPAQDSGHEALRSGLSQLRRKLSDLDRELAEVESECRKLTVSRMGCGKITHRSQRCRDAQSRGWQLLQQIGAIDSQLKNSARREKILPGELRKAYSEGGLSSLDDRLRSARQTLSKDWSDPNS